MYEDMDDPEKKKRASDYTGPRCKGTVLPSKFRVGDGLYVVTSALNKAYLVESRRDSYQPTDIEKIEDYYKSSDDMKSLLDSKEVTYFSPEQLIKKNEFLKYADYDKYVKAVMENRKQNRK
uniref:ARAD1A06974p n=1 Tax=Blastobotrys adeninivorans TaxID=409370 RepID=A0A060SX71_BLAAD